MNTLCRLGDDTTSVRLQIDFVLTLKRLRLSKEMQLYKTINSVKSIFLGFSAMVPNSYPVEKVLENTDFAFYILSNAFQKLFLVDTTNKKGTILGFAIYSSIKERVKTKIFLVIKTIDLILKTFLNLLYV